MAWKRDESGEKDGSRGERGGKKGKGGERERGVMGRVK